MPRELPTPSSTKQQQQQQQEQYGNTKRDKTYKDMKIFSSSELWKTLWIKLITACVFIGRLIVLVSCISTIILINNDNKNSEKKGKHRQYLKDSYYTKKERKKEKKAYTISALGTMHHVWLMWT